MRQTLLALGLFLAFGTAAAAIEITTCGRLIPAGEVGTLQSDLVCRAYPGVVLESGATLDLKGFSLYLRNMLGRERQG